ncbi:MAG: DoxX family protein [Rhodopila sp.]|nr:DoxX family protein [Rhodopila sp.]
MSTLFAPSSSTQDLGMLVGRVLMSAIFIWSGYGKLMAATATQAYLAGLGVPLPAIAWLVAVVIELGGGLALLLGIQARLLGLVLAVWCIVTALAGHTNFAIPDMQIHFMKNVAMAGGFLQVVAFGAGRLSADRR